ncbi:MAG: bifunctional enoyl-CoA hydratase/phosphate acetyltransferase [Clostridia bacterium]|nr:bifunctional enoyl-CoA hydratase/phosphate acetyltransferase [Clostridia bacterium]
MVKNLKELLAVAKEQKTMRLVVAAAQDSDVLIAVCKAAEEGIIEPVLVGDIAGIKSVAAENNLDVSSYEMVEAVELEEAAKKAVAIVKDGKGDFIMKGLIDTSILLKAVVDREHGLRTDNLISHVMIYEVPSYHKMIMLTDGGMNITPNLEDKKSIINNSIIVGKALGIETLKIACLAAKEKVHPKMQATVDAAELEKMSKEGAFGEGVIVEGPLAFDLAISKEAAEHKGFKSEIAGDTDVLMVPTIEMGNGIGKTMTYFANASSAGVIMGAKVPVVLVSRADSYEAKLNSIALGSVIAANN